MALAKGRYPWRIGATSFVIPAAIEENVRFLADQVDDIQLLFFESPSRARLPQKIDLALLRGLAEEHQLSYTVHLPTDLLPGHERRAVRRQAIGEILRLMAELESLPPLRFDLHLAREQGLAMSLWLDHLNDFLSGLKSEIGALCGRVAIENLDYPFEEVRLSALQHGFDLCLDVGHCLFYGHDLTALLRDIHPASHLHYHGVREGRDHQALGAEQLACTATLGRLLQKGACRGVVTLEVYNRRDLHTCLQHLAEIWSPYQQDNM